MNKPVLQRHRDIVESSVASHLVDTSLFHGINHNDYSPYIKDAFAQYIANNEKVEDAILLEAREICADQYNTGGVKEAFISGNSDDHLLMRTAIEALQRREPVRAKAVTEHSEEQPWLYWDGDTSPVASGEFVEVMWDWQVFAVLSDIVDWEMVSRYRVPSNPSFKANAS